MEKAPPPGKAAAPTFVHLKVHSAYSLLEGAITIPRLAKLAAANDFPALGLSDTGNLFGALEFSDKVAGAGIQPIVGCTLQVDFADRAPPNGLAGANQNRSRPAGALALFACSAAGYQNLMKLASRAFFDPGEDEEPHIGAERLKEWGAGLISLTGGPDGPIDKALREDQKELAAERLKKLQAIFGDRLYVELQRHGLEHEIETELALIELAYARGVPIVATNEVYFAAPDDYEAHDALLCIAEGRYVVEDDRRRLSREHFFKTADQMAELFADLPEALANTVEIARRCAFRPTGRKPILPRYVKADANASEEDVLKLETAELRAQAEAGLKERLASNPLAPGFTQDDYHKRLTFEVDVISKMKFPGYFLIVADFIKWAKASGIPVGPGRGSGAGSVVAWALTITDLDPLRFGLLFERFLNPERVSMPDFDIDFCQDRRDEVIRYVQGRYGADRVAQIITHGKLQARAVLRDVGRVLQMPYGQVDRLCKLVPINPTNPVTLAQAIEGEPKLQEARESEPMVARLLEIAQKLEGLYRHASTHAAGMVIGDRPLDELVPLYRDPKSSFPITQFNWKLVEAAGLVKFDFLGLKTLTVLQKAVALIKRGRGVDIDLAKVPLDDKQELRDAGAGRHGRRVPARRHGHAREPQAAQARPHRGHHRHGGAVSPRPHGQHPDLHQPQARRGAGRLPARHAGADPEGDLRRHRLPGAGDADRPGDGGLLAGRGRPAAPRHGQERQEGDGAAEIPLRRRRGEERRQEARRGVDLRAGRQVRRLRLQQEPRRRLRARQLSHGLPEGELPRGVPGRLHDARCRQHRQARHVCVRGEEIGHRHPAALHQRLRGGFPRR